ncbi:MAG: zinc dependent phospholipase C family protein [Promethearchaeota archaeon]|jgi:hypothetical protein
MATWGAHFRIAEKVLNVFTNLDKKYFTIGNIAPDCGMPNKDWSAFTPSKDITHYSITKGTDFLVLKSDKFILNDVKFFSNKLKSSSLNSSQIDTSFLFGYFIHLITDNLWNYYIMQPLKEKHLKELQKNPKIIWKIKTDWYDLDKKYITENKESLFWTGFLEATYDDDFLDFLPKEGIQRQLKFIKNFYQISTEEYMKISKRKYNYLQEKDMDDFIKNSTDKIIVVLTKLNDTKEKSTEKISFLENILRWN